MELLKDYDCKILFHPGKANIVYVLSRKSMGSLAHIAEVRIPLIKELHKLEEGGIWFELIKSVLLLAHAQARSSLMEKVKETQGDNLDCVR